MSEMPLGARKVTPVAPLASMAPSGAVVSTQRRTSCLWFRKCLRVHDSAPLSEAASAGGVMLPLYVVEAPQPETFGARRAQFLIEALEDLDQNLSVLGSRLCVVRGDPEQILAELFRGECAAVPGVKIDRLYWEAEAAEPVERARDARVQTAAAAAGVEAHALSGHCLFDTEAALAACDKRPPRNMKGLEKLASKLGPVGSPLPPPRSLPPLPKGVREGAQMPTLKELGHDAKPSGKAAFGVVGGETAGLARLKAMMNRDGGAWARGFEKPKTKSTTFDSDPATTILSPYVAVGCVSARTFHDALIKCYAGGSHASPPGSLLGQLYFREMAYLHGRVQGAAFAASPSPVCADIPWDDPATDAAARAKLEAWEHGKTGYPLIDAAMRQLREQGFMHHLARHAVACFLTRGDLWLSWTHGAAVFERDLLDADWALNNFNWLWLAGVAPWSAPYFRVYSPIPNHKSSALNVDDADGAFVDRFVPELKGLPAKYKYAPWTAPLADLNKARVKLGETYPRPVVDHKVQSAANIAKFKAAAQRNKALAASLSGCAAASKKRKGVPE